MIRGLFSLSGVTEVNLFSMVKVPNLLVFVFPVPFEVLNKKKLYYKDTVLLILFYDLLLYYYHNNILEII